MARATPTDIEDIMGEQSFTLDPFIAPANRIVEDNLVGKGIDEDTLTQIEIFIACHLVSLRAPVKTRESIRDASVSYQRGDTGMGLAATEYGQTAMTLDPTSTLASMSTSLSDGSTTMAEIDSYDVLTEE